MNIPAFMKPLFGDCDNGAIFSQSRTWRYVLWRKWNEDLPMVAFCGLNPSTADEENDDPTLRRCIGFAKSWGYGGLYMLNIFAFRATYPREMEAAADPIGPDNDRTIKEYQRRSDLTVACWGVFGAHLGRGDHVLKNILTAGPVKCLGRTRHGQPRHPLYLPKNQALEDLS